MDTALKLKILSDNNSVISKNEILRMLYQSETVYKLTADIIDKPLFYVWRIIALSEIPYSGLLTYTQNLIDRIYEFMSFEHGFSLSGDNKMFLPCYNAMISTALCRLGMGNDEQVKRSVEWIKNNQPFERNIKVDITGFNFKRYGGCFNNTPCYIGLVKSVAALNEYNKTNNDGSIRTFIEQGIEYILKHQLYKRLSSGKPITAHILDISYPESYHLNIVELVRLVSETNFINDIRSTDAVNYIIGKKTEEGWKISYRYRAEGYMVFDKGKGAGDWVTYVIRKALKQRQFI